MKSNDVISVEVLPSKQAVLLISIKTSVYLQQCRRRLVNQVEDCRSGCSTRALFQNINFAL